MMVQWTLLVSEPSGIADDLCHILEDEGMMITQVQPGAVLDGWDVTAGGPDLLLVNANLRFDTVQLLARQVMKQGQRAPTLVVFVDDDYAALEPHVEAGLDYLVPPYVSGQVNYRLLACEFRQAMSHTAEHLRTNADLLRYEKEMAIGREIQEGFLPAWLPAPAGWVLTARSLMAREVGGDFYDAFEMLDGRRIALIVADVCDKGVGAALFMALIRSLLRHTAVYLETTVHGIPEPDRRNDGRTRDAERLRDEAMLLRALASTNDYLTANHLAQGYFATLYFAILDPATGSMVYVNCGHNPPVIRRHDGSVVLLHPTGPALGLVPAASFHAERVTLEPGDLLFAYTDGVTEARNLAGDLFGDEQMESVVCTDCLPPHDLLDMVVKRLGEHAGSAEQSDDITMLAMQRDRPRARRRRSASG